MTLIAAFLFAASLTPVDEAAVQKLVSSQQGKVVVVNFWATWCGPCRKEMPELIAFEKRAAPKGVKLILISADEQSDEAKAAEFLTKVKAAQPWYLRVAKDDDKFINSIDPKWSGALPATFIYDRNGKRVRSFFGEVTPKQLEAAIAKL